MPYSLPMDPSQAAYLYSQGMPIPQQPQPQPQPQQTPYSLAPAFMTQQGTFYFMPRQAQAQMQGPSGQAPPPAPLGAQAQYPPPLQPAPLGGGAMQDLSGGMLPNGGMMPSGLPMSVPVSASSSQTDGPSSTPRLGGGRSLEPASTKGPKPKKKAKSSKDQPKRFICEFEDCGRAFARAFNLQTHEKSHLNIRDFACAHCDKRFSRRHDRGRHCAAVHPEAINEDLAHRDAGMEDRSSEEYPDMKPVLS